jgi:hypothetical protein
MGSRERTQRYRQRQRDGVVHLDLLVSPESVAALAALGWSRPGASPDEVREAFVRFIGRAFECRISPPRKVDATPLQGPRLGELWQRHVVG